MKKLWLLLLCQAFAGWLALGQPTDPAPARAVTSYALTSSPLAWSTQPAAWRLLASNDGQTWTQLDVQSNLPAANAGARRFYQISNRKAYRIYRLQVDANAMNSPRDVGVSEIELMGPVVGVTNEMDLQANITASQAHPVLGAAVNAFDGNASTKWLDYAPFEGGGCWIQCEYVRQSELLMTNIYQVRIASLLTATPTLLLEKSSQIISNINTSVKQARRNLMGYALTSGNDFPTRDPSDWRLLGSNDGGKTWETVDTRHDEIFSTRLHRRVFMLAKPAHDVLYRLSIQARTPGDGMQLTEVEPLYSDQQADTQFSLVISASGENPPMESTEKAFTPGSRSKWFCFTDTTNQDVWIQWQCLPKVAGLPLINLDQLNDLISRGPKTNPVPSPGKLVRTLTSYSMVSAGDDPVRDPLDWTLLGSDDLGKSWKTLDVRRGEKFSDRLQKRTFTVANPKTCAIYRLQFESILTPTDWYANSIQLAELQATYAEDPGQVPCSLVVSARGDNAPLESVEKLFDGDPHTKWLDFSEDPHRASWVQWYFVNQGKLPVMRADSKPEMQPGLPKVLKLELEGAVVFTGTNTLGLLDKSGFEMFQFESAIPEVKPGERVQLTGLLGFGGDYPLVRNPNLVVLGPLTTLPVIQPKEEFGRDQSFVFGSAKGRVAAVSEGQTYTTVRLAPETGAHSLMVKILNPQHLPLPVLAGHRIQVQGVVEPVFDEDGRQYAGVIWVAGQNDLTVMPGTDSARPMARFMATNVLTNIAQANEAYKDKPDNVFNVKVRGVITFVDLGLNSWYLQNGPDAILVQAQLDSGLSPYQKQEGMYVEMQGTVGGTNGLGITPTSFVKVLGKGRMPEPLYPSMDTMVAGNCDGKWVQLEGVVAAFEKQRLTLSLNGGQLMVWVNEADLKGRSHLLGSLVRVSGVCDPVMNNRQQRLGVRLLVPSADWVEIVEDSPAKPFDLPTSVIGSLLQPGPRSTGLRTQLRKITGVVTYKEPQMLFVQNNGEAVRIYPRDDVMVDAGDTVEAVGIPQPDGLTAKLVQALIKKTGSAKLPEANPIDVQWMSLDNDNASQDATRGWVQATLLGTSANESVQILELQQDTTKMPFRAYLPGNADRTVSIPIGSRLRLEGAFKAKSDAVPDFGQVVNSFEMYLNSAADITVLERPAWWTPKHTLWLLGGSGVVLFGAMGWIRSLRVQVHRRTRELNDVITQHEKTEEQLQEEISERRRMQIEVEKTHRELLDASRQAGMAEVATSVLHNVGNVLNSVNVSSSLVADSLRKSSGANLAKVVALMEANAGDLGAFITSDEKGKNIPIYLDQLAKLLDKERSVTLGEVENLRQNIEHIKEIVVMQQTYARVADVTETVNVAELAEDALRMNGAALTRHDIKVIRDFDPQAARITVQKHKVLQILVNVIRNAKYACDQVGSREKLITLRVRKGDQKVSIVVTDTGVGIPPENLTKIFNHGFTTRKDGHGFGLHSGALAAKELGGSFTVHSDGLGFGATFTLELPLQPPKAILNGAHEAGRPVELAAANEM